MQKPHENGDVESSHGHLKTAVDQALRLRGNRDFTSAQDLMAFIEQVVARRNALRAVVFREECAALEPLPLQRLSTFTVVPLTVKPDLYRSHHLTHPHSDKLVHCLESNNWRQMSVHAYEQLDTAHCGGYRAHIATSSFAY